MTLINLPLITTTVLALISLLEPITTVSFYAKLHPEAEKKDYKRDGKRIALVVFISLIFFFFIGQYLLQFFGLKIEYFRIAGGIVLGFIAFSMVRGEESDDTKITKVEGDHVIHDYMNKGIIVPLVFPLTINTGLISYVVSIHGIGILNGVISIIIASILVCFVVMFGGNILRKLGEIGVHLIIRFFGLFLLGVSVQTIGENILKLVGVN